MLLVEGGCLKLIVMVDEGVSKILVLKEFHKQQAVSSHVEHVLNGVVVGFGETAVSVKKDPSVLRSRFG